MSETALPRAFDLLNQGPGLLAKRKFSVWHLLSSSYFQKIGFRSSLEAYYEKNASVEKTIWMSTSDKTNPTPSRSSSTASTPSKTSPSKTSPSKTSPEKQCSASEDSPVVRRLVEVPLLPDPAASFASGKKKKVVTQANPSV